MAVLKIPTCRHGCTDECFACYDEELAILRPIAEAAKGLAHGEDWNNGTHAKIYRPKLLAALQALDRPNAKVTGSPVLSESPRGLPGSAATTGGNDGNLG